jgi:hypothetical protein
VKNVFSNFDCMSYRHDLLPFPLAEMDIDMLDCCRMSRQSLGLGNWVLPGLSEAAERDHGAVDEDMFFFEISIR